MAVIGYAVRLRGVVRFLPLLSAAAGYRAPLRRMASLTARW